MKNRIVWKFFGAVTVLTLIVVFVLNFFVALRLSDNFEKQVSEDLKSDATLVGDILSPDLIADRQKVIQRQTVRLAEKLGQRITIFDEVGRVIGDSQASLDARENHADRLEVAEALESGFGQSTRFSDVQNYNVKYVAVRVSRDDEVLGVVRFALPLSQVQLEKRTIYRVVLWGAVAAVAIAVTVAYFLSRSITLPIRQMDRIRTDFVANVSHELRTPLTLIKGYTETLQSEAIADKDKAGRFVSIIKEHTDRLGNIVEDLLTLSRLESSKDLIHKERFDLKALVEDVALGFGHAISSKKQTLKVNPQGDDFSINADRDKIEQVLVNLTDNAVKYTGESGRIDLGVEGLDREIRITVRDTGIGIAKEHIDRIFERFYRADKARSRKLGGTGLGLSIAKHIVLAHNGRITIDSDLGRGTTVTVTLPRE